MLAVRGVPAVAARILDCSSVGLEILEGLGTGAAAGSRALGATACSGTAAMICEETMTAGGGAGCATLLTKLAVYAEGAKA